MVKVEKEYVFDGPQGAVPLRDLFEGRRQLIVYHMMFDPAGTTACKHCSCVMDNIAGGLIHLTARDTSFATISRAPITKIEAFKKRMQWTFPWVSSFKNDFNYDYHVTLDPDRGSTVYNYRTLDYRGELPGLSVFFRDNDLIFHSYSTLLSRAGHAPSDVPPPRPDSAGPSGGQREQHAWRRELLDPVPRRVWRRRQWPVLL
jgi:predicted dithiol-disulfide oxidoreductase (DUF899 family)